MRMRLMLLGGGNALGQALIRLGAEEDIGFLAPRPPAQGWDAASLTQLLDDNRPDVVVNLAYYYDWFQSTMISSCCSHRATGYSTVPEPRPIAKRTRWRRWMHEAGRFGASSRVCVRYARDMSCCVLAGCSMTVGTVF